jgi:photosystem II stability/assembly factor-like uncharacterized protein
MLKNPLSFFVIIILTLFSSVFAINPVLATTVANLPQWQLAQMPNNPSLRGSAVINDSLWVSGSNSSVFVSQDAGKSWQDKSVKHGLKTDFRDIALFDKNTAIVMGVGSGNQSILYKTIDGGNSWKLLYQNKDKNGFFDSIAFWNEQQGLLLGDPTDGFYVVSITQDGGKTWRRVAKNMLPEMLEKEAAFAASGNTLIVGKQGKAWLTTGGFSASVYMSVDFGESWQRNEVPIYSETQTAGGYGLALNRHQQVFVLGGDYLQRPAKYANLATYHSGKWHKIDAGNNGLRTAMICQSSICLMTGKTGNDISFNSGKTWSMFRSANEGASDDGFYTIAGDKLLFLAAGANGNIGVLSFKSKTNTKFKDVFSRLKK